MKKPEKKKCQFGKHLGREIFTEEEKGYNQAYDDWVKYIKFVGGIAECMILHEDTCTCQNDT